MVPFVNRLSTLVGYSGPFLHASMFFLFCKPIVQVDGTHLFGKYKGTLLIAVTQDDNNNVLPLAFAIVESKNDSSWMFFLKNVRQYICTQDNLCIISDFHDSIRKPLNEIGWVPCRAVHCYCICHFAANFQKMFKDVTLKKALTIIDIFDNPIFTS